jgi:hypothetical protein
LGVTRENVITRKTGIAESEIAIHKQIGSTSDGLQQEKYHES